MKSLRHKLILVAGGAGDIGSAVMAELGMHGARSISMQRRSTPSHRQVHELHHPSAMRCLPVDLVSESDWRTAVDRVRAVFGKIDGMAFCVGSLPATDFTETTPEEFQRHLETNVLSLFFALRVLLPIFKSQGEGSIVVVGSMGGVVPLPYQSLYAACKYAVRGCALSLSEEYNGSPVSVSLLSVGPVQSRMIEQVAERDNSAISFINRPLLPQQVAIHVCRLLLHPKRELILPRVMAPALRLANLSPTLFHILNRLLRPIGVRRQRRYRKESVGLHAAQPRRERVWT
ncbi:MAG: SDR family oxidoreductase [Ignavibacteriales bacterium]|nr:SDR family oxidoreductase [Ignavibacteriales bacterium]